MGVMVSLFDIFNMSNVIKRGKFRIFGNLESNIYFDVSEILNNPRNFDILTDMLADSVMAMNPDRVAGAYTSGIPLATAISLKTNIPMVFIRREPKEYGLTRRIEGKLEEGDHVVLVDDVFTFYEYNLPYIEAIEEAGGIVTYMLVIVDFEVPEEKKKLARKGVDLVSLTTVREIVNKMKKRGFLPQDFKVELEC